MYLIAVFHNALGDYIYTVTAALLEFNKKFEKKENGMCEIVYISV